MKRILKVFAVLLLLGITAVVAIPLVLEVDDYRDQIQARLSEELGMPVQIEHLVLSLMPTPKLVVSNIEIRSREERVIARVDELIIAPRLMPLLDKQLDIRHIHFNGGAVDRAVFALFAGWAAPAIDTDAAQGYTVTLDRFSARNMHVALSDQITLGPLSVEGNLDRQFKIGQIILELEDGSAHAKISPEETGFVFSLTTTNWPPSTLTKLSVDKLDADGTWIDNTLTVNRYAIDSYEGKATGKLTARWGLELSIDGIVEVSDMDLEPLLASFDKNELAGLFNGNFQFSANRPAGMSLLEALNIDGDFLVKDGVIHNTDLKKAGSLTAGKGASGGDTPFKELSGHIAMAGATQNFSNLVVLAKGLRVEGSVTVDPESNLKGIADIGLDEGTGIFNVPVTIAGTTEDPLIYPTKSSVIGGAIGTVILPGVGTAVGIKAGQFINKLFSSSDDKPVRPDQESGEEE